MNTTYTDADLVSFAKYVLSPKREERLRSTSLDNPDSLPYEEKFREVYDADLANWREEMGK